MGCDKVLNRHKERVEHYMLQNHIFITILRKADVTSFWNTKSFYIILIYYSEICWLFTPLLVSLTIRLIVKCNQLIPFSLIFLLCLARGTSLTLIQYVMYLMRRVHAKHISGSACNAYSKMRKNASFNGLR
jgi:hypothetical protein